MGSLSDFAENELLDHLFNAAYSASENIYLALCTADPTDSGTGATITEVADANNYARKAITFGAAASRRVTQNAEVEFNQASGAWGEVTHWAILDGNTHEAGNMLAHGAFSSSFSPVSGNIPKVASSQIYVEISDSAGGEGFTTACCNSLLDLMFRNQAYSKPDTYVALLNAVADDADGTVGDLTEITGTDYAREQVNINGGSSPTWDVAADGALDNTHKIDFGTVGAGGWDEVVALAIVDSASGAGNVLCYDNANVVDQTPAADDTVEIGAGDLDISLS
jgi:hypothetical protein